MRSGSYQQSSYAHRASPRRRAIALVFAIAADVLLVLLLLRLTPGFRPSPVRPDLATFRLLPDAGTASADASKAVKTKHAAGGTSAERPSATVAAAPQPPAPTNLPLNIMTLSHEDYAAADISKLPSHQDAGQQAGTDASAAGAGDSAYAEGKGPNGEQLYQVEWYRRPTKAELSTYLPRDAPEAGWGLIECQTVERFHVDNCRELADSPPGSGYARAVREAAWQFLVRPPRLGGKSLIGAWVGIRIDYSTIAAK